MANTQLQVLLEKRNELLEVINRRENRAMLSLNNVRYISDLIGLIYDDVERIDATEDFEKYKEEYKQQIFNLIDRAKRATSELINKSILYPVDRNFFELVNKLTIYLRNWNNIYKDDRLEENIKVLLSSAQLVQSVPDMLAKVRQIIERTERMLIREEVENPIAYKAAKHYLDSIKQTYERKNKKEKVLEEIAKKDKCEVKEK